MARRSCRDASATFVPPMVTVPEAGSHVRVSSEASVDLPEPEAPTMAVRFPAGMWMLTPFRTVGAGAGASSSVG